MFDYNPSRVDHIEQNAGEVIEKLESVKVIGGIDLLKLDNLTSGYEHFIQGIKQLDTSISALNKLRDEDISREISEINQAIVQLSASTYFQEKIYLTNSLHQLSDQLRSLEYLLYSVGLAQKVEQQSMSAVAKALQQQIRRIATDQLVKGDQDHISDIAASVANLVHLVSLFEKQQFEIERAEQSLLSEQLLPLSGSITTLLDDLNDKVDHYNVMTNQALSSSRVAVWVLGSLLIFFSLITGWFLRKSLIQAVESITISVEKLEMGELKEVQSDFKQAESSELSSLDEFQRISQSIKSIADYQHRMIFDIDADCQEVSMGILDQHSCFQYQGEYQLIGRRLKTNKEHSKRLVTEIIGVCNSLLWGKLAIAANSSAFSGDYKEILQLFKRIATVQQQQLDDMLSVTKGMELGLSNKAQFSYPTDCYSGAFVSLQNALHKSVTHLSLSAQLNDDQNWLKSGLSELSRQLTGEQPLETLSKNSIDFIANYLNAPIGYFYRSFEEPKLGKAIRLISHYGVLMDEDTRQTRYKFVYPEGVGLIGQVFIKPEIIIKKLAEDERKAVPQSAIANALLNYIVVVPLVHEGRIEGVLELGLYKALSVIQQEFLSQIIGTLGIAMNVAISRDRINLLLEQSQNQTEELAIQQARLSESNKMLKQKAEQLEVNQLALQEKNKQFEQASITMEEKNNELVLVSQYKSEFLANMSHELRSPLNSLLILSNLLIDNKKGNMDEAEVKYAQIIHRSGSDLLMLIEDILDHAKIESGKTDICIKQESLTEIVQLLTESFQQIAIDKQIEYRLRIEESLDKVSLDKQRVLQVLTNLLSNAFKFTEAGLITLNINSQLKGTVIGSAHSEQIRLTFDALCFCVEDSGIGIAEENKELVFKAFSQADGTTSRKFGGTGLGLSITQHLVELMGGFMHLESALNEGSNFYVYLPLIKDQAQTHRESLSLSQAGAIEHELGNTVVDESTPKQVVEQREIMQDYFDQAELLDCKKILIVDDHMSNVFALTAILENYNVNYVVAESGQDAINETSNNSDFDLILMDIMMPNLDGYETIKAIRSNLHYQSIPIIALTAKAMPEDRNKCIEAGANDYMTKPIDTQKLLTLMNMWLVTTPQEELI